MRFGIDFWVGDLVRCYPLPDMPIDDLVEAVARTVDANQGEVCDVVVGGAERLGWGPNKGMRNINRRLRFLETGR